MATACAPTAPGLGIGAMFYDQNVHKNRLVMNVIHQNASNNFRRLIPQNLITIKLIFFATKFVAKT